MKHSLQSISALVAVVLLAACSGPESPTSKSEWAALQGVEYEHREMPLKAPIVLEAFGHRVAGLPSTDGRSNIWVLLNPEGEPLYKQMPDGDYSLSSAELATLAPTEPVVLARLQSHVQK